VESFVLFECVKHRVFSLILIDEISHHQFNQSLIIENA